MPSVVHIVVTGRFAGVERYVCDVATETSGRDWDVAVIGGEPRQMPALLGDRVRWEPGATVPEALRAIGRVGRADIYHAHMTKAEALAVATRRRHKARVVSTRHFAARRGASHVGRIVAPWIATGITREIAISAFVAGQLERPPDAVIVSGVPKSPCLWQTTNRVALVLQRLEPEKDTITALRAWQASRLVDEGWSLRLVGEGSERGQLERWVAAEGPAGVTFAGWSEDVSNEFESAGMLLASAPAEPLGLAVLEAMAAGVPVVACASGGHRETVGRLAGAPMFAPGDAVGAGDALRGLLADATRSRLSDDERQLVSQSFGIEDHVDRVLAEYAAARGARVAQGAVVVAAESR
jgi:glycosyltransferase involved in cell wall biosynthesis